MPILRNGEIIENRWLDIADEEVLPAATAAVVSLQRWQNDFASLKNSEHPLGLRITGDTHVSLIANDLQHFDLVSIVFPTIADGRGYSQARLIRQRYGYTGELRATGPLVRDIFAALDRVGFDTIEARDENEARAWSEAVGRITVRLQPDLLATKPVDRVQTAAA